MNYCFESKSFENIGKRKNHPAIICRNKTTSWQELYQQVLAFSVELELRASKQQPLVIYGHKEHQFIVAILAANLLSIPFVPVDRAYPRQRLNSIQEQLGAGLLYDLTDDQPRLVSFNHISCALVENSEALSYLMFTSGSTGKPKGVKIPSKSLNNLVDWVKQDFNFSSESVVLNQALFSFDVSILDLVASMSSGGSLLLADDYFANSPAEFMAFLKDNHCTDWISTPSFVTRWLLSRDFDTSYLEQLKRFILIGESVPKPLVDNLHRRFGDQSVWNAYGPTEATVIVTSICLTKALLQETNNIIPIGTAMPNSDIYLVDDQGIKITDSNISGEIVICGNSVSSGYLDSTIPANQAFFQSESGAQCYKTGDIGYFDQGLLYFCSRKDEQVKLNGYRIEMSEIQESLLQAPCVVNAEVIPLQRAGKVIRLVGFVFYDVENSSNLISENEIKSYLSSSLPKYMVPSEIIAIDAKKAPYSNNYKIDKKALTHLYTTGDLSKITFEN